MLADSQIGQSNASRPDFSNDLAATNRWKIPQSLFAVVQCAGPVQEADQLPLLLPNEAEKLSRIDGVGLASGICFDAPAQIVASPRPQAMSTRRIPKKPHRSLHCHGTPEISIEIHSDGREVDAVSRQQESCSDRSLGGVEGRASLLYISQYLIPTSCRRAFPAARSRR